MQGQFKNVNEEIIRRKNEIQVWRVLLLISLVLYCSRPGQKDTKTDAWLNKTDEIITSGNVNAIEALIKDLMNDLSSEELNVYTKEKVARTLYELIIECEGEHDSVRPASQQKAIRQAFKKIDRCILFQRLLMTQKRELFPMEGSEQATIHARFKQHLLKSFETMANQSFMFKNLNDENQLLQALENMHKWYLHEAGCE